jgi:hypothetical protein
MALTFLGPLTIALAAVLVTVGTCAPSGAQSDDPIDTLERSSIALVYIDNTEFGVGFGQSAFRGRAFFDNGNEGTREKRY